MRMLNLGWKSSQVTGFQGNGSSCDGINDMEVMTMHFGQYEKKWTKWLSIPIVTIFIRDYYLQYTSFFTLSNKESVILSPVIIVRTLRRKVEIKKVAALTRLPSLLVPWHSLNWLNGWGRETIFGEHYWDDCTLK